MYTHDVSGGVSESGYRVMGGEPLAHIHWQWIDGASPVSQWDPMLLGGEWSKLDPRGARYCAIQEIRIIYIYIKTPMMYLYNTQYNILYYHGYLYAWVLYKWRVMLCTTLRHRPPPPLTLTVGIELLLYVRIDRVRYLNSRRLPALTP